MGEAVVGEEVNMAGCSAMSRGRCGLLAPRRLATTMGKMAGSGCAVWWCSRRRLPCSSLVGKTAVVVGYGGKQAWCAPSRLVLVDRGGGGQGWWLMRMISDGVGYGGRWFLVLGFLAGKRKRNKGEDERVVGLEKEGKEGWRS
ncbi:hypothetical protein Dimus_007656, partial [Dionaea muscipula]